MDDLTIIELYFARNEKQSQKYAVSLPYQIERIFEERRY